MDSSRASIDDDYDAYPAHTRLPNKQAIDHHAELTLQGAYDLLPHEEAWKARRLFLKSKGYELRPRYSEDWSPSWIGTDIDPFFCEDSIDTHLPHIMDATLWENEEPMPVIIKAIPSWTNESNIACMFSFEENIDDPRNHCVPVMDIFTCPTESQLLFLVTPLLRAFNDPPFAAVEEVVDFVDQILQGIEFIQLNGVAHRDITRNNIMMDGSGMYPEGFHPVRQHLDPSAKIQVVSRTRAMAKPKYYIVNFDSSVWFPADMPAKFRIATSKHGADDEVPEMSQGGPYDPFKVEIFQFGNVLKRECLEKYVGLEFLEAIVRDMTHPNPHDRPSIGSIIRRFTRLRSNLRPNQFNRALSLKVSSGPLCNPLRSLGISRDRLEADPDPIDIYECSLAEEGVGSTFSMATAWPFLEEDGPTLSSSAPSSLWSVPIGPSSSGPQSAKPPGLPQEPTAWARVLKAKLASGKVNTKSPSPLTTITTSLPYPTPTPIQRAEVTPVVLDRPLARFLVSSYVKAGDILRTCRRVEWFSLQAFHISRQALHLIIRFNESVTPDGPTKDQLDEGLELDGALEELEKRINKLMTLSLDDAYNNEEGHINDLNRLYKIFFIRRAFFLDERDYRTNHAVRQLAATDRANLMRARELSTYQGKAGVNILGSTTLRAPSTGLTNIFDTIEDGEVQPIDTYVREYVSPTPLEIHDTRRTDELGCRLAPSFGYLTKESIIMMDNELKVILSGTLRTLRNIPTNKRSWEAVMGAMRQNSLLETAPPDEITHVEFFIKEGQHIFKFGSSPDPAIMEGVEDWFNKLISDSEILAATKIDVDAMAKIVARTGASVTGFLSGFKMEEYHERVLMDIGVLRFPEPSHPFIKVYCIQLKAWSYCDRVLVNHEYRTGVAGEFHSRKFYPNKSVIEKLAPAILEKANREAEDLFK